MTEREWLACADPKRMLRLLLGEERHADGHFMPLRVKGFAVRRISDRKSMLFNCACCRTIWPLLVDERSRQAVIVAEQFADDEASEEEVRQADVLAGHAWKELSSQFAGAAYLAWQGNIGSAVEYGQHVIPLTS